MEKEPLSFVIKQATEEDSEVLSAVGSKTFEETWGHEYEPVAFKEYLESNFTSSETKRQIQQGDTFWIGFHGETPVGYAKVMHSGLLLQYQIRAKEQNLLPPDCKHLELQRMYILKEYHGTGVAKLLMESALKFAEEKDVDIVWLGVWGENKRALNFYQRAGFEIFGQHEFVVGDRIDIDLLAKKEIKKTKL